MRVSINLLTVSKIFFLLYIVYTNVTSHFLFFVNGLSFALLAAAFLLALVSVKFRFQKDKSLLAFVIFAIYVIISGAAIAFDFSRVLKSALNFIEFLISFFLIIGYSNADKKIDFAINAFVFQGLVTVLFMLFRGTSSFRVSIAENVNVNTIGTVLAFSIAFVLYEMIAMKKTTLRVVTSVVVILLFAFGIMLTVSKKSIIAGAALIILWIICCYRTTFMKMKRFYRILLFAALIAAGYYVYRWYMSNYATQVEYMLYRMSDIREGDSTQERLELIKEGFQTFLAHPVFGVGFNNARYYSVFATYTHCFYVELLACTGIVGTLFFGYGIIHIWNKIIAGFRRRRSYAAENRIQVVFMIIVFLVLLIYSWTQIIFYTYGLIYPLFVLSAFGNRIISQKNEEIPAI